MSAIIFNGTSSESLIIGITEFPRMIFPEKAIEAYSVPGRNGDVIMDTLAAKTPVREYDICAGQGGGRNAVPHFDAIADWLLGSSGYCRLEDTFDPAHYRMAYFKGPLDVENQLAMFGVCTLQFVCDPRRFLLSGEQPITLDAAGMIFNPTPYTAKPIIMIHGSGAGTLSAGGKTLSMTITDGMVIDSEKERAYIGASNLNNTISGSFPVLLSGENFISFGGGVTSIEVIPNTWRY